MVAAPDQVRLVAFVRGSVQGVGFRWWTRSQALELALAGFARNLADGRVEVQAQGQAAAAEALLARLLATRWPGRPGVVDGVTHHWLPAAELGPGFDER